MSWDEPCNLWSNTMSVFNPQQFLHTTVDGGEKFSTTRIVPPEGEYLALVDDITAEEVTFNDQKVARINVSWELLDEDGEIKKITHRDKNTVRQRIRLDLLSNGELDRSAGMNDALGRFLTAIGMNGKRYDWLGLKGLQAKVLVTHTLRDDVTYANVTRCWNVKEDRKAA
jgi:hypothetical protein